MSIRKISCYRFEMVKSEFHLPGGKTIRGRPRMNEAKIADVREHIIACAKDLFRKEGYSAVSMRRLAAQASCGVATIYEYFPSKSEVLRHIWADFFDEVFGQISAAAHGKTGFEAVKAMATAYIDYWFEHPDRFRMVFLHEDRSEQGEPLFAHRFSPQERLQPVISAISVGQAAGAIRSGDPTTLLQVLMGLLHGIALNLITISEFDWVERERLVSSALRLLGR